MTVRQAIAQIADLGYFSAAKWAVSHILGTDTSQLFLSMDKELSAEESTKYDKLLSRLKNGEPMQYVMGKWQFIDLDIITDKRALIPRPETELLAMKAAEYAKEFDKPKVYDLGCGTGCIGLYVKKETPGAEVTLCDISDEALSLAKENSVALGLDCRFKKFDMLKDDIDSRDMILSNPPYILTEDIAELEVNVKDYEPLLALDGGKDGLDFYRALARISNTALSQYGVGIFEIGIGQREDVCEIFAKYFEKIEVLKDFSNIDRIIIVKRG